jgi:Na+-driven multidrug efflux pump
MRLIGLTMPVEAMVFVFMHALLGAGDARRVMMVGVGSQWLLFLPLAYLFGPVLGFGLFTIWLLQNCSRALSAFLYVTMWRGRHWQRIVV